jgi:hypothetical protein
MLFFKSRRQIRQINEVLDDLVPRVKHAEPPIRVAAAVTYLLNEVERLENEQTRLRAKLRALQDPPSYDPRRSIASA